MAHTRKSLLLDDNWDLSVDIQGNIAVSLGPYTTAQNVANECRLFTDDAYFATERGIPYFLIALGKDVSPSVIMARLREAALLVEDVAEVKDIQLDTLDTVTRRLTGTITFTSVENENGTIEL